MQKESKKHSLANELFHREKIELIARQIHEVYSVFNTSTFIDEVMKHLMEIDLMQRIYLIRDTLRGLLPDDYAVAIGILLRSLPKPCSPHEVDDDFGDFIYAPYGYFVSTYGCNEEYLSISLDALHDLTKRFSVEGPIRVFLNTFPRETLACMNDWVTDEHYHVRRLVSEGTRPLLPWAQRINIEYTQGIPLLDVLYYDPTRFVTRSVANHLNDISKKDPDLVVFILKRWKKESKQNPKEMNYIIKHALRTAIKDGHTGALSLLGYARPKIVVSDILLSNEGEVCMGDDLCFSFTVRSDSGKDQKLMIDYKIHYLKQNSKLAPKVFKLTKKKLLAGESLECSKKHSFGIISTRKLYPGEHMLEIQINGITYGSHMFALVT